MARRKNTGSDLVRALCDYLAYKRYFFYRSNNIPAFEWKKGVFRSQPKYAKNELPDIVVVKDGIYHGIEAKSGSGRLSVVQKGFRDELQAAGGRYYEIRSLDELGAAGF